MMKPKIRFNGFTDDWEQRKLSELVQIERGGSPRPIEAYITDAPNGLNWVKIGDAPVQGHYITKTAEKIKPEGLSKTRQVQPGDLILSNSMSFGKPYIMGIDGCIHDGWLLIRDNKKAFDLTFLYHLLGTPQMLSQYKSLAAGSTVNNLNKELVGGTIVTIPNLDEQQVLGQYLESLDNLITLHQRKCDGLKKLKKYMLQNMFPQNGEKTPKIRFQGFINAWEQRKLSELVQIERGGSPRPIEAYITDAPNGLNWVKIGDAPVQGHYITKTAEKIKPEGLSKTRQVQPGDLILSNSMSFGKPYIMGIDGCIHDGWLLIRDNKKAFDLTFLYHLLGTPQMLSQYKSLAAGSTVNNLNKELVGGTIVTIPNLDEQQVLGQYLESLDNLITLHQRKCDGLKKLKKYMLQNMFPQNGEKTPKIRFQGFINAWEQRKLEEIYQNIGNAFVGTATPYYVDTGHFYLESNNIKDGQINRNNEVFINDEFYERQKDKWLHTGDMVMVQSGHVGHTAVIPEELDNSAAHALIMFRNPKIEIEPYFLNYQYQTIKSKRKINNITTGNTIKHILASDMYNFIVDVSDIEEQQQIANYFLELDHLITLHQRKVEQMKNLKKYMLQNMFPAEK